VPHRALGSQGVAEVVADAALRANLGRIRAHRLRHTAARAPRCGKSASFYDTAALSRPRSTLSSTLHILGPVD
jgi:hypothetical protein